METIIEALLIFAAGYLINIFYISILYHRGLTHRSLILKPTVMKWIGWTGPWVTGIDPKAWACMHRLHHLNSDTKSDPHSPIHQGVWGVALGQLRSYESILRGLILGREPHTSLVKDLPFNVNFLNRNKLWQLPYLVHLGIAVIVGILFHHPLVGAAYFLGMMSHPVQGWMVNSLAHRFGYRNFPTNDNSKNNVWVALLVFGEGYQNNHHTFPESANFAVKRGEIDLGYILCRLSVILGLAQLQKAKTFPSIIPSSQDSLHKWTDDRLHL